MISKAKYPKGYPATASQIATLDRHAGRRYARSGNIAPSAHDVERVEAAARKRARKGRSAD